MARRIATYKKLPAYWRKLLRRANLETAKSITNKQLHEQTDSLEGAIMPNGHTYAGWLKDKEGRGEDGENSGP
jgi:hypothetical protein